jgi:hypothetical protein
MSAYICMHYLTAGQMHACTYVMYIRTFEQQYGNRCRRPASTAGTLAIANRFTVHTHVYLLRDCHSVELCFTGWHWKTQGTLCTTLFFRPCSGVSSGCVDCQPLIATLTACIKLLLGLGRCSVGGGQHWSASRVVATCCNPQRTLLRLCHG